MKAEEQVFCRKWKILKFILSPSNIVWGKKSLKQRISLINNLGKQLSHSKWLGRPIGVATLETYEKFHDKPSVDWILEVCEIAEARGMSHDTEISVLSDLLNMRKLFS